MQIAALSDIHGNLSALLRVWSDMENSNLTDGLVLNAGDSVCYGDSPEETVRFLESRANIVNVQGNYDRSVARFPDREKSYRKKWAATRPEKFEAVCLDSSRISWSTRLWLNELPREVMIYCEAHRVILTHYSPGAKEGIGPWTSNSRLEEIASQTLAEVIVCGHTHFPFVRSAGNVLFVNPGTVGRSPDDVSTYAVLNFQPDSLPSAEIKTVIAP